MNPPRLAFAESWWKAWNRLDAMTQREVNQAVEKLRTGGPSMVKLHGLEACEFHGFSVNRNALRAVTYFKDGVCVLLHVDEHDKAYKWATSHRLHQVGDVIRLVRTIIEDEDVPPSEAPASHFVVEGPLAQVRDREFKRMEVSPVFAQILRRLPTEDAVMEVATSLKPALGEALIELAAEPERFDEALRTYQARQAETGTEVSIAEALANPRNQHKFWVPPPGEEALARALDGDFEAWRVFLHPSQRRIVHADAKGAVKVTGGPGTGKTVVALHRARHLVETVFADDPRPVLVTAFSQPLVDDMRRSFSRLVSDRPELMKRVRFETSTKVAQDILRTVHSQAYGFLDDAAMAELWAEALKHDTLDLDAKFYAAERREVVARHDAWTEDEYLRAKRSGRALRLDRGKRRAAWAVIEALQAALQEARAGDVIELSRAAQSALTSSPFAAVVVDELQDMAPESLRFLARLAADDQGQPKANGLFLAGDGFQRIYRTPVPLSHCGVDIVGRSHHLRLNYRTTEGIRAAAVEVISGQSADPLDDGDVPGYRRYRSVRNGPPPERLSLHDAEAVAEWIAERAGAPEQILVLARTQAQLDAVATGLRRRGLAHHEVGRDGEGVRLSTLHRAKGLESPGVVVLPSTVRRPPDIEPDEWTRRTQSLTYVGISRARDWCAIVELSS